jgi:DNA-binding response OmpR family regulator
MKTVLLVEDDAQGAQILREALTAHGFTVLWADGLARAIQLLANQRFNCVVVDMFLGTERGSRVIQQIRRNKQDFNHTTPVVAMSGSFDAGLVAEVRGMVNAALVKPFNPRELVGIMEKILEGENRRQEALDALRGGEEDSQGQEAA